ncbi:KIF18A, partial [Cervus elaphus hippelaphus]
MSVTEEDLCHHMKVVVRVRPENTKEKASGLHKVVHVVDKHILVFDPKQEEISFFHGKKTMNRDITKRQNKDLKFVFDAVFDENSTQLEVFEHTTKPILRSFLNGYNCTVLAYGATGAGKTHTMLGSAAEPGVMYLTMLDLYKSMDEIKEEKVCSTAVSYLEVYNEQIRDLLVNSGPLAVREDAQKGVVVQGLTLHQPKSSEEILQLLDSGNRNRTQHPTDTNATSSRSHAVFQIYLRQQDKTASINQNVRIAKMSLIDLAGSERASATSAKGTRFIEGTNINRSLLALGNVINALADTKCFNSYSEMVAGLHLNVENDIRILFLFFQKKNQHIPYRNSKLTRLLKDSLGGNCQTIMIAAVSPSSVFYDDTYNTLKYANRAKDIKSSLKSNVLNLDNHITQYVKICNEQKKEILMLKEKLKAYEEQKAFTDESSKLMISNPQKKEIERFQEILNCLFQNREEIRQEYLKLEMLLKENELKSFYQQQCHKQIEMMCSEDKVEKNKDLKAQIKHMMDLASLQEQQHRQTEACQKGRTGLFYKSIVCKTRTLTNMFAENQGLCKKPCVLALEVQTMCQGNAGTSEGFPSYTEQREGVTGVIQRKGRGRVEPSQSRGWEESWKARLAVPFHSSLSWPLKSPPFNRWPLQPQQCLHEPMAQVAVDFVGSVDTEPSHFSKGAPPCLFALKICLLLFYL